MVARVCRGNLFGSEARSTGYSGVLIGGDVVSVPMKKTPTISNLLVL